MKLTVFRCFLALSPSMSNRISARSIPREVSNSNFRTGINATMKSFKKSILSPLSLWKYLDSNQSVVDPDMWNKRASNKHQIASFRCLRTCEIIKHKWNFAGMTCFLPYKFWHFLHVQWSQIPYIDVCARKYNEFACA